MDVFYGQDKFAPSPAGVVLTIGNFDGVHRGHARLVALAHDVAGRLSTDVAAMTFHPHPLTVLAPERAPEPLVTLGEKLSLLDGLGVAHCIVVRSEPALLTQLAEDFLASLVAHCRPRALVEGPDFHFGRGRSGSLATLREHAGQWNYEVHEVPVVHCAELPTHPVISSSSIRQALRDGRIDEANAMLGRPYRVVGTTAHGAGRGTELGFPTANLEGIAQLLPQQAVYAGVVQLDDGGLHLTAVNIGPQPTFRDEQMRVEAHVLDFEDDLRGRRVGLHFLARLREQERFDGPGELAAQLRRDVEAAREFVGHMEALRKAGVIGL